MAPLAAGGGVLSWIKGGPQKWVEGPAQLQMLVDAKMKGYSLTTLTSIGNWVREQGTNPRKVQVPLSQVVLWHPVRGPGERAGAGPKTTARAAAAKRYMAGLMAANGKNARIFMTQKVLNTEIPEMKSSDDTQAVRIQAMTEPAWQSAATYLKNKPAVGNITRAYTSGLKDTLRTVDDRQRQRAAGGGGPYVFYKYDGPEAAHLERYDGPQVFYLVSSGQGRLQAIKEAATELDIPLERITVELTLYDIDRGLCALFTQIGNDYRVEGKFKDTRDRHAADNVLLPIVRSCHSGPTSVDRSADLYSIIEERKAHAQGFVNTYDAIVVPQSIKTVKPSASLRPASSRPAAASLRKSASRRSARFSARKSASRRSARISARSSAYKSARSSPRRTNGSV